jgi:hypothetical protein
VNPISEALTSKQKTTILWMREKLIAVFGGLETAAPRYRENFIIRGAYGQGGRAQISQKFLLTIFWEGG